jgi:argininosuccinate synthase
MSKRLVLAYSGGLDTSVAVRWLRETLGYEVIAVTVDLGSQPNLAGIRERAMAAGAVAAHVVDGREEFVRDFCWPALQANALYEGIYPLATALGRPLLAKHLVAAARKEGARYVAHGSTGKGNDQVRFDVAVGALAPELEVVAPMRAGMGMSRDEEMAYARTHSIPVEAKPESPYSVDENLWGRSIEAGVLEDPDREPPADVYLWTADPQKAPATPQSIELEFRHGVPVALDGKALSGVELVDALNRLAGSHGVGRIDHVESRVVGIKSREIYEAPAAVVLHRAHRALESLTLSADTQRFNAIVSLEYANLVYAGQWFSALHRDLGAYLRSNQRFVSGTVRIKLYRGSATVVGRQSPYSLYRFDLATYSKEDLFDHKAAEGFVKLVGLPLRTQAQVQGLQPSRDEPED